VQAPNVLRAEATLNTVTDFRVYRPKEGAPEGGLAWRALRRGIADLHRRGEVSRKATERYLDALASVDQDTTLEDVLLRLGQPTYWHGRRVRALQPFAPDDRQLIQAISRGEFALNGVRNRDLQRLCVCSTGDYPDRGPPTLSLGQSKTAPAARSRSDLQGDRHSSLPPHQSWTHSDYCHPHRSALQRPSAHCRRGMKCMLHHNDFPR